MHTVQSQLPPQTVKAPSAADRWYPPLSESSFQAAVAPPQNTRKYHPLLVLASAAMYFGWPVVIHAYFYPLSDLDPLDSALVAGSALLWFASCIVVCTSISSPIIAIKRTIPRIIIMVSWLVGGPFLFAPCFALVVSTKQPDRVVAYLLPLFFCLAVLGMMLWYRSCYCLYDELFTTMEARLPATKGIRPIVSDFLRSLLHHH
jgi:hypothetical protein